jgi:NTP pyrophosphatase (non-canonical NTP hydrolase)
VELNTLLDITFIKNEIMMKFEDIYNDISRINKKDPATNAERLGKLFEETGELAKAINKTNGRKVLKEEDTAESIHKEVLDEAADSVQNVISIIDGFGFTCEDLVQAIANKNKKWERKVDKLK